MTEFLGTVAVQKRGKSHYLLLSNNAIERLQASGIKLSIDDDDYKKNTSFMIFYDESTKSLTFKPIDEATSKKVFDTLMNPKK